MALTEMEGRMKLTEETALRAYARMMNTLGTTPLEPLLADHFVYESHNVFAPIESKQKFLGYFEGTLETIAAEKATVFAELGEVEAYGSLRPCVVLAQNDKRNLVGLVLAEVSGDKASRLDLCVVPAPQTAQRSGQYPS